MSSVHKILSMDIHPGAQLVQETAKQKFFYHPDHLVGAAALAKVSRDISVRPFEESYESRLEAGQSQVEVAWLLQVVRKWSPGCGINQACSWPLCGVWKKNFQVNALQPTCRDCPLCPASSLVYPFDYIQQERQNICGTGNISRGHHKNGGMFFSVICRNSLDKVIFVESLSGDKEKPFFSVAFLPGVKSRYLEEWALLSQILIDALLNSMTARYEACTLVHDGYFKLETFKELNAFSDS
ncbi:hypothetical protein TNCV_1435951 [Trichonephila clavipes]|nr:hypothetical protein TNCV_1435951 [Trichonephila clavipes]